MRGEDVRHVQERLIALGHSVGEKGADGVYGSSTFAAIRQFQTERGLPADGIIGAGTLLVLNATVTPTMPPKTVWTAEQVESLTKRVASLKTQIDALGASVSEIMTMMRG